jgi:hypothetical protein
MPKTGSTALQNCLAAARDRLAAHGALWPENPPGCPFNNHRLLLFGFLGFGELPRHVVKHARYAAAGMAGDYAGFLAHVAAQVAAARPETTILSCESLYRPLAPRAGAALAAGLAAIGAAPGTVRIAVYLRRPSAYYLSALQQRLQAAHGIPPPRVLSPVRTLAGYAAAFGRDALAPRVYDRRLLARGDIVADFLAAHLPGAGLDAAALPRPGDANTSLSAEAMDLMRRFRLAFHPRDEDAPSAAGAGLLRALRRIDRRTGAPRPRLRPELAEAIDYARPDPLVLRDAWGLVFPDLDYDRLARRGAAAMLADRLAALRRPTRLEAVVEIDPARRRALAARLAETAWAGADPARAAWAADLARAAGDAAA